MFIIYNKKTKVIVEKAHNPLFFKSRELDKFRLFCEKDDPNIEGISCKGKLYPVRCYDEYQFEEYEDDAVIFTKSINVTSPEDIIPNYTLYIYNKEDYPYFENDIAQIQKDKQEENKTAFNNYLLAHPYEYNGKQYGTTLQDQLEINLMLSQAQAMVIGDEEPQVEWHATTEVNESMSVSDLLAIQAGIKNAVAASYKKMQKYKKAIFDCTDAKTLVEMSFEYEGDENA